MAPYQLLFGNAPKQSWDWASPIPSKTSGDKTNHRDALALAQRMHAAWKLAKDNMEKAQARMQAVTNRHRRPVD